MIGIGEQLDTSFALSVVEDGQERSVTFGDLLTRPTIVSIYMKNKTGSCDKQNASLAEAAGEIDRRGFNLIALSKDTCRSHTNYATKMGITYMLASDPDNRFAHAAGAMVEKKMRGKTYMGPARAAFLIDPDGTVRAVIEKVTPKSHGEELLTLLG